MVEQLRIGVHGACGRMGQRIVDMVTSDADLVLAAAIENPSHPRTGEDIGPICGLPRLGVQVSHEFPARIDGIIDFSVPEASLALARRCAVHRTPLVVATTGFSASQKEELIAYHHELPLLLAANCSLVVNLLMSLAKRAARVLRGKDFDVEIVERHHRYKADAPSGTALRFAEIIEKEMGLDQRVHGREGITGERPRNQLGLHAIRVGDNVGEHQVIFSTLGETMELVHRGHGRDSYAKGAVEAIKYLITRQPGLYSMADVLGLGDD